MTPMLKGSPAGMWFALAAAMVLIVGGLAKVSYFDTLPLLPWMKIVLVSSAVALAHRALARRSRRRDQ